MLILCTTNAYMHIWVQYTMSVCVTSNRWLYYTNTQGAQQWRLKRTEDNKRRYHEAKDEKRLKERESERRRWKPAWKLMEQLLTAARLLSWLLRAVVCASWLSNLCLSLGLDQNWQPVYVPLFLSSFFFFASPQPFFVLFFFLFLSSPFCHIIVDSSHWAYFCLFLSPSLPSDSQTSCREQWAGKEQQEGGGVQPAGGQRWVCSRIRAHEGANTDSVSLFSSPPQHTNQTNMATTAPL